ncbi:MAG: hypothetical protein Q9188_004522 [Gyalolechia gomerana]
MSEVGQARTGKVVATSQAEEQQYKDERKHKCQTTEVVGAYDDILKPTESSSFPATHKGKLSFTKREGGSHGSPWIGRSKPAAGNRIEEQMGMGSQSTTSTYSDPHPHQGPILRASRKASLIREYWDSPLDVRSCWEVGGKMTAGDRTSQL